MSTQSDFDNYANEYDKEPLNLEVCKGSVKVMKELELLNNNEECLVYATVLCLGIRNWHRKLSFVFN